MNLKVHKLRYLSRAHDRLTSITDRAKIHRCPLLSNSGQTRVRLDCPLCADFVAKVGGPLQVRNFRIQRARRLNQCCAAGLFFESMLRVGMRKIFLQQYLPEADICGLPFNNLSVFLVWLISARAGSDQQSELLATPGGRTLRWG
jgi:hypothetical protein